MFLGECNTKLAEALHHFKLAPLSPHAAAADASREERVCARGAAAMIAALAADVRAAQRNAQCAGSACSHGAPSSKPLLPVDNIIMDEAACSTDYIMPCLLATLPVNLVRFPKPCPQFACRTTYTIPRPVARECGKRRSGALKACLQVLVGDPKQLEATSEFFSTHIPNAKGGLQEQLQHHTRSAMQRLTETWAAAAAGGAATPECRLSTQYRMHDSICQVVDAQFYRGQKVRARSFEAVQTRVKRWQFSSARLSVSLLAPRTAQRPAEVV